MAATYLVTSATGSQGGSVVRELLARDLKVHAYVRDSTTDAALEIKSLGAVLFEGDFDNETSIAAAIKGCTGVFLNTFPGFLDPHTERKHAQNFINAAVKAKTVTTFVASTVLRPSVEELAGQKYAFPFLTFYYRQKGGVEKAVRKSGIKNTVILRPGYLTYNVLSPYHGFHFPGYPETRVMEVSYGADHQLEFLDAADVGKFAAAAFADPERFAGEEIDLFSEKLTVAEIASTITKVSGVEIKVSYRTDEETEQIRRSGRMPAIENQIWVKTHPSMRDNKNLEKYGIALGTLEGFLEREKDRLLETLGVAERTGRAKT
ncbi:hypothetical protein HYALB_00013855 [Hymenoscyphus albidus]|uniref:NmrA-like domain-containing protein n=1 Tax=Hymenoscyphus albidus TaxID=595503 RepID=A0A9N9M122_9HELO|nr:hypothetical protein HYALB_00013408 [Hymenoscyphus albidus]CAG8981195.1 hypothetical protein HYALB_00013855 [Hymenoscyphus albidus]